MNRVLFYFSCLDLKSKARTGTRSKPPPTAKEGVVRRSIPSVWFRPRRPSLESGRLNPRNGSLGALPVAFVAKNPPIFFGILVSFHICHLRDPALPTPSPAARGGAAAAKAGRRRSASEESGGRAAAVPRGRQESHRELEGASEHSGAPIQTSLHRSEDPGGGGGDRTKGAPTRHPAARRLISDDLCRPRPLGHRQRGGGGRGPPDGVRAQQRAGGRRCASLASAPPRWSAWHGLRSFSPRLC